MPQNNVLPDWRATYPNDAPAQKPGGVTVATTATAPRVPNKFVYAAGTIQMVDFESGALKYVTPEGEVKEFEAPPVVEAETPAEEAKVTTQEEAEEENMEEIEDEDGDGDDGPSRTTKRTTTRTTTRHR